MTEGAAVPADGKESNPTYAELLELLESAPLREVVVEDRYWSFRRRVDAVLQRIDAARDAAAKSQ